MIICKHDICRIIFVHIFGDICVCPNVYLEGVRRGSTICGKRALRASFQEKVGDLYQIYTKEKRMMLMKYTTEIWQLFVLSHHKYIIVSIHLVLFGRKKSPAWSIPDQIRDVRIFLSGLPRPRPLSSRWSYPGRGQITFEKIIENSEMGIWSLVSFSFSFVIKTLQILDISP